MKKERLCRQRREYKYIQGGLIQFGAKAKTELRSFIYLNMTLKKLNIV